MKRFLKEAALIAVTAAVLGLGINLGQVKAFFRGEFKTGFLSAEETAGLTFITLGEAEELFARGDALFIDARSQSLYAEGHILNAVNYPAEENREALSRPLDAGSNRILVVYCEGGDCLASVAVAKVLKKAGFEDVRIFSGGWAEWSAAGRPSDKGMMSKFMIAGPAFSAPGSAGDTPDVDG